MKSMKKCAATNKNIINYKRRSSAGLFNTSSAGAVTSLILVVACFASVCLINFFNSTDTYAANLSLSITGSATVDIAPLSSAGDFAKSGDVTISASTDGTFGYQLMIQAANSTNLVSSSNDTIASLPTNTSITESAFSTGDYNGKWGYKPSMYNSVSNSTYRPSPSTSTGDIINVTNCANGTSGTTCTNNTDNYTFNIGTKVNMDQPFGEYSNTFSVILISNAVDYSITYNSSMVTNMPTDVSGTVDTNTVTISSDIPVRDGYAFDGWCTVMPTANGDNLNTCSGTTYTAGQTIALSAGSNNFQLYAMWRALPLYMQNLDPSKCTTTATTTVYDNRDEQIYTIQRLADGKCWMLDNLRFDAATHKNDITISNTHTTSAGVTKLQSTSSAWTSSSQDSYTDPYIAVSGTCSDNSYCANDPSTGQWNSNSIAPVTYGSGSGKIGVYYNYCVASGGTVCTSSNSDDASYDICPAGWQMPPSGLSGYVPGNYYYLFGSYGQNETHFRTILSTPLSGSFYSGSAYNQGNYGRFWSSTRYTGNTMYILRVDSSGVNPVNSSNDNPPTYNYRNIGYSVRCLLTEQ